MSSEIELSLTAMGTGSVKLNGTDIANALAGFTINANAGEPVTLLARLSPVALKYVGELDVRVPATMAAILKAAGWTPPPPNG